MKYFDRLGSQKVFVFHIHFYLVYRQTFRGFSCRFGSVSYKHHRVPVPLDKCSPVRICVLVGQFAEENCLNDPTVYLNRHSFEILFTLESVASFQRCWRSIRCHHFFIDTGMVRIFTFPRKKETHGTVVLPPFYWGPWTHHLCKD
jgi:hypothetical protein